MVRSGPAASRSDGDGLGSRRSGWIVGLVNLHGVVLAALPGALTFLLLELVLTLALDVDAAVLGHLLFLLTVLEAVLVLLLLVDARHLGVIARPLGSRLQLGFLAGFLLGLLCSVFVTVGDEVGLGLLWRELGRGRSLGIPEMVLETMLEHSTRSCDVPLDGESGDTGLLREDVALHALDDGLGRGLRVELLRVVLIVDVVSHSHKLAAVVGTGQKDDSNTEDVGIGDARRAGSLGLEDKLIDADGDGPDEEGVELLVILVSSGLLEPAQAGWVRAGGTHEVADPT